MFKLYTHSTVSFVSVDILDDTKTYYKIHNITAQQNTRWRDLIGFDIVRRLFYQFWTHSDNGND